METEMLYIKENGLEKSDYYQEDSEHVEIYVFDVGHSAWGWRQFIPVLDFFDFEYDLDRDTDTVHDDEGTLIEVPWIWDEIERYADEVAAELQKVINPEGSFFFGHLDADGAYGLFYSHPAPEEEDE